MSKSKRGARLRRPASASKGSAAVIRNLPRDAENEEQRAIVEATDNLSRAMHALGVNGSELARKLKIGPASVSRLLSGEEGITVQRLARAAFALGLSVHVEFRKPPARR